MSYLRCSSPPITSTLLFPLSPHTPSFLSLMYSCLMYSCLSKKNCCHCLRCRNFISLQRDAACHCRYTTPAATIHTTPPPPSNLLLPLLSLSPLHAALSSHFAVTIAMYLRGIWGIYLRVPIEHKATATTATIFTAHTHEYTTNEYTTIVSSHSLVAGPWMEYAT